MTDRVRVAAVAAWGVLVATGVGLTGVALAIDELDNATGTAGFAPFAIPLAAMAVLTGSVGLIIRVRRPDNRIGKLMTMGPLLMLSGFVGYAVGAYRGMTVGPTDVLGGLAATWGGAVVLLGIFLTYPAVIILFPDGHLPTRSWRYAFVLLIAVLITGALVSLFTPGLAGEVLPANPIAIRALTADIGDLATGIGTAALLASVVLAVVAVIVRFRRATGVEREQLKWLVASAALAGILFPISFLTDIEPAGLIDLVSVLAVALVPAAIGVAILRYRLYEIDRIISRTIGWAIVTGVLVAVFSAVVVTLQAVLVPITNENTLAVAASTLVAFALFQPLRWRVQRSVDRWFDRSRYDGQKTVDSFGERLRNEVAPDAVPGALVAIAVDAVQPRIAGIWLRNGQVASPTQGS